MPLDIHHLRRYDPLAHQEAARVANELPRPPANHAVLLIGAGNSGESVVLRCQALSLSDGLWLSAVGINNDQLAPRSLPIRRLDGAITSLDLSERLVLHGEHPRDRLQDYPLLARRYRHLLRGILVKERYVRAGAGGHGHPVISALDLDLHIDKVLTLLRRALRSLRDTPATPAGQSDLGHLLAQRQQHTALEAKTIVVVGGASGSMGNAAHQILPMLLRWLLAGQGIANVELWGVLLGPRAFTGLTPFVRQNARALLEALEFMSCHGQHRRFINDLAVTLYQPPYDRVFLLDDPLLPGEGVEVTEPELERFLDQAALCLTLLLRGTVWQTIASHTANPRHAASDDQRLRYLHTARATLVGVDRVRLTSHLSTQLALRVLDQLVRDFGT